MLPQSPSPSRRLRSGPWCGGGRAAGGLLLRSPFNDSTTMTCWRIVFPPCSLTLTIFGGADSSRSDARCILCAWQGTAAAAECCTALSLFLFGGGCKPGRSAPLHWTLRPCYACTTSPSAGCSSFWQQPRPLSPRLYFSGPWGPSLTQPCLSQTHNHEGCHRVPGPPRRPAGPASVGSDLQANRLRDSERRQRLSFGQRGEERLPGVRLQACRPVLRRPGPTGGRGEP